jgi:hypothetical protein
MLWVGRQRLATVAQGCKLSWSNRRWNPPHLERSCGDLPALLHVSARLLQQYFSELG